MYPRFLDCDSYYVIRELGASKKRNLIEDFEVLRVGLADVMVPNGASISGGGLKVLAVLLSSSLRSGRC